jgi:hypothetical protein
MRRALTALALTLCTAGPADAAPGLPERPPLPIHQGAYFRYAMPAGWQATESANGVEMAAPDRVTGASFGLLVGAFGQATPESFLRMVVFQNPAYQGARIEKVRPLPSEPGVMGLAWSIAEIDLSYTYLGRACRAQAKVGILQGAGQYAAVIRGFQAPVEQFAQARYWLPAITEGVVITNPYQVAGIDRFQLPKGTSHDYIYGDYNRAWERRGHTSDAISRGRHEGTMGYERMVDPSTGQLYDMPLERYDATRGGYVNPNRPTEVLDRAPVGY